VKGKRVSIVLSESDKWQQRPLYLELLRTFARENVEYAFVIRTLAGFTRVEDMTKKVALLGVSGYQPLIIEFADSLENVERAMTRIAEMTAGKAFTTVDVEISPRTVSSRPSS
jgi:PII-like signaling protein